MLLAFGVLSALPLAAEVSSPEPQKTTATRKSHLVIMVDDCRFDELAWMPAINSYFVLAGMTFKNAYVPNPLCCPCRTSFLTGVYAHNHRVWSNDAPKGGDEGFRKFNHAEDTFALQLQLAGYATRLDGKYLNDYKGASAPTRGAEADAYYYTPVGWTEWGAIATPPYPGADSTIGFTDGALGFIASLPADKPFFAFLSVIPPHIPHMPEERYRDAWIPVFVPRGSYDEEDVQDKRGPVRDFDRLSEQKKSKIEEVRAMRARSLLSVDDLVARVEAELKRLGRDQDTFVWLFSDNGWPYGEHRYDSGKGAPYEEFIRTPFYVHGPGLPQGVVREHLVSLVDMYPTFMELAGLPIPEHIDGRSLVPLLQQNPLPESEWRKAVLIEDDGWKAVRYRDGSADAVFIDWGELYDLTLDPYQMENLLHWSESSGLWPEHVRHLQQSKVFESWPAIQAEYERLKNCGGVSCR